ncbi:MAG: NUDIX domain-containing protein, partial [Bacteroidia bacterium]
PKGKIEKDEKKKAAAMREVEEECGISGLTIIQKLTPTFHSYNIKGKRVLKISYWYEMKTVDDRKLIPQLEEDITEARWVAKEEIPQLLNNSYSSIKWLMEEYLKRT